VCRWYFVQNWVTHLPPWPFSTTVSAQRLTYLPVYGSTVMLHAHLNMLTFAVIAATARVVNPRSDDRGICGLADLSRLRHLEAEAAMADGR